VDDAIAKLVSLSSAPEGETHARDALQRLMHPTEPRLLFESALMVLPRTYLYGAWGADDAVRWRDAYGLDDDAVVFALDLVGGYFALERAGVTYIDPEFGGRTPFAESVDAWADVMLSDFDLWSGHSVCRAWQLEHGALAATERLAPQKPIVLGGRVEVENLVRADMWALRDSYAALARDLVGSADGTPFTGRWRWADTG
jgi:hypothetical protein